mgnify:CR=1 FL=1
MRKVVDYICVAVYVLTSLVSVLTVLVAPILVCIIYLWDKTGDNYLRVWQLLLSIMISVISTFITINACLSGVIGNLLLKLGLISFTLTLSFGIMGDQYLAHIPISLLEIHTYCTCMVVIGRVHTWGYLELKERGCYLLLGDD